MGIFRSHLFPHLIYLAGLTIVCVIGLKSLVDAQLEFSRLKEPRKNAVSLIKPEPVPDSTSRETGSILSQLSSRSDKARRSFLGMLNVINTIGLADLSGSNSGAKYPDDSQLDGLKEDLRKIQNDVNALLPKVVVLNEGMATTLLGLNQGFTDALEEEDNRKFFRKLRRLPCDERLDQLRTLLDDRVYGRALAEVSRLSEAQEEIFEQLKTQLSYTLIWLIVLSALYLYAVNTLLARPVKNLSEVARIIAAGRLVVRAEISTGGGPVAELCDDFNRMVDMLVESLDEQKLSFEKLKSRTDELQAANEHKNRFIANISHELKTPLNAVIGFADILMSAHHGPLSEKQMDYLSRIHAAGKHLLAMICDLIDVMKLDLNAMQLKPEKFDIKPVTSDIGDMLMPQIQEKGHKFTMEISPDLPEAEMDLTRFRQILMNLLSNAIKFTDDDGTITLRLALVDDMFKLDVIDNGIGISKKDQHRIFQDFIQLDSKLHRKHEGTGIGLALTRRLVDIMGGELTVTSKTGEGSTFTVILPVIYDPSKVKVKEKRVVHRKMMPVNTTTVRGKSYLEATAKRNKFIDKKGDVR